MQTRIFAILAVAAFVCTTTSRSVLAAKGEQLAEEIAEAAEAQEYREEAPRPVVAEIVEQAPAAELNAGTADVSTTGDCSQDIDSFCVDVTPGGGRISDCLTGILKEAEKKHGNAAGDLSDACKDELAEFKADRSTNINKDLPLATACKEDAEKFCSEEFLLPEPGAVLTCLREVKEQLGQACSAEVFRTMEEAAEDFRNDAMLYEMCVPDAEALCSGLETGEGRIQDCLRGKRAQLSWDCQEELFRQEVENADNILLSVTLFKTCLDDKKKFCNDVKPGNAHAKDCLEEKRNDPGFSEDCKVQLEKMMERRAQDFRLDPVLREVCLEDIEEVCGYEKESLDSIAGYDGRVINCLMDYKDEILRPACKSRVVDLIGLAAEDIRFNIPLADACYEDRQTLCEHIKPGSAGVIRCLQDEREQLSYECRATLFDTEVRNAESIDFQYPIKKACKVELEEFCANVPHGNARALKCLEDNVDKASMGDDCRAEVKRFEMRENQDYRLNYRLSVSCEVEVDVLCADACGSMMGEACGGQVLRCLTNNRDKIKDDTCRNEVDYFIGMEVTDFRNDVLLAEACRGDVDQFCPDVKPGDGRVLSCLRDNQESLSKPCDLETRNLEEKQNENFDANPILKRVCKSERASYCQGVKVGRARVIRCLQENMSKSEFGESCKNELTRRLFRKTVDYRLDPGVSKKCANEIDTGVCQAAKAEADGENAAVLKCLVKNVDDLSGDCQSEVARSTRTALWAYKEEHPFTMMCDADVDKLCLNGKPVNFYNYGTIGRCLAKNAPVAEEDGEGGTPVAEPSKLSAACAQLVRVGAPPSSKKSFATQMTIAGLASKMERAAGLSRGTLATRPVRGKGRSLTISGWTALIGMMSLVVVMFGGAYLGYRKVRYGDTGLNFGYTMVMKSTPPSGV